MEDQMNREETILRDAHFPRLDEHIEAHARLTETCREVLTHCDKACLKNQADDCTVQLSMSILEHIVSKDLDFKSFLQAAGLAEST